MKTTRWMNEAQVLRWCASLLVVIALACSLTPNAEAHTFLSKWGSVDNVGPSTPATLLAHPVGIATDSAGYVYVTDSHNYRICKYDGSGIPAKFSATGPPCIGTVGTLPGELSGPWGVAIDGAGNVYVGDADLLGDHELDRVCTWDGAGVFRFCWDGIGSGVGAFNFGGGNAVAIDASGAVYVADTGNHRVCKFNGVGAAINFSGATAPCIGGQGSGLGQLFFPNGITTDGSGNLYVADSGNARVCRFNSSSGALDSTYGLSGCTGEPGSAVGQFWPMPGIDEIRGMAIDPATQALYVGDNWQARFCRFDSSGVVEACWGSQGVSGEGTNGRFQSLNGVAIFGDHVYVVDMVNHRIQNFHLDGTDILISGSRNWWGSVTTDPGDLDFPHAAALDPSSGEVLIADTANHRVCRFADTGRLITCFGSFGTSLGELAFPKGIGIDASGNVYVVEAQNDRLCKFDGSGNLIPEFGTSGCVNGYALGSLGAGGVAVYTNGGSVSVYVSQPGPNDVCKFDGHTGQVIGCPWVGSPDVSRPTGVAVDTAGNLYVANAGDSTIKKFDQNGILLAQCGGPGTDPGRFSPHIFDHPLEGLAVSSTGTVFVADGGNSRVQELSGITGTDGSIPCPVVHTWGTSGNTDGSFHSVAALAVNSSGSTVYAVDRGNLRIQKFIAGPNTPSSASVPPGRAGQTSVYDQSSNRLIVFGGSDAPVCCPQTNDLWVLTNANGTEAATPQWINLIPHGTPGSPSPRFIASGIYDPGTNRMIIFGGHDATNHSSAEIWVLTNANGLSGPPTWIQLFPTGGFPVPISRTDLKTAYDTANNRLIVFGGANWTANPFTPLNDVWVLTNANGLGGTPQWINLIPQPPLGSPSPRYTSGTFYDQASNRLVIFGGCTDTSFDCTTANSELWGLDNANGLGGTPTWVPLVYSGGPPTVVGALAGNDGYDQTRNQYILFGGRSPGLFAHNETWVLTNANGLTGTPHWIQLTPENPPSPRIGGTRIYDASTNRFIVFGGIGGQDQPDWSSVSNDSWVLTNADGREATAPTWIQLLPTGGPVTVSPGSGAMVTFSSVSSPGTTTVTPSSSGPPLPAGFELLGTHYDISTTAAYTPPVTVCIQYGPPGNPSAGLYHYQEISPGSYAWVDVTTTHDVTNGLICGQVTSLSPFAILLRDTTPPVISLTNPGPQTYACAVTIEFDATDSASGVAGVAATLNGDPVSNGQIVTLTKPGLNTLSVTATDAAGNSSTETVTFSVTYNFIGFLDPINNDDSSIFQLGRTVPIKFQLTGCNGVAVTTAVGTLAVFKVTDAVLGTVTEVTVDSSGIANTDNLFRYSAPNYIYNLSTKPYSQGTYRLQATLDDGTVHTIKISLKGK